MTSITDRIDAVTHIPPNFKVEELPPPQSVKVELTAQCDLKCFFCATSHGLREKGYMDLDFFKKITADMKEAGVEELGLFYLGESMLYPHLAEAIEYAKHELQFPYVFLTTNGVLSRPDKLKPLFYAGLDSLKFSFNSSDGEQMKEVTQVDAFEKVVWNIQSAKAARDEVWNHTGHKCGLYASSILYEGAQRDKMERAVNMILPYVDEHYFLPLYSQHMLTANESEEKGFVPTAGNMGRIGGLVPPLPCWAVSREGHVTWDGLLTACCFSHTEEFTMGDLNKQTFMEAWNSPEFRALRKAHLDKDVTGTPCSSCVAYG